MGSQYDCQVLKGGKDYHDETVQEAELQYEG